MGCSVYSKEELLDNVCIDNKWYYVAELYTSNGYFFYRNAFEPMGKSIVIKCSKNSKALKLAKKSREKHGFGKRKVRKTTLKY